MAYIKNITPYERELAIREAKEKEEKRLAARNDFAEKFAKMSPKEQGEIIFDWFNELNQKITKHTHLQNMRF